MFDSFMGMPMHPLLVHAVVVFVPLLAIAALVYALVPPLRARVGWAAVLLAIAAPVSAFMTMQSGEALERRLIAKGYPAESLRKIAEHADYGTLTFWCSLGLALATVVLVAIGQRTGHRLLVVAKVLLGVAILGLSVAASVFVFLAGDSGARMLWGNV